MMTAKELVKEYGLLPHPEGGFYKETYRCKEQLSGDALPERFSGYRSFSTAIYFLMEGHDFSAFHRIKSDECWHFYTGDALLIHIIDENGSLNTIRLGSNPRKGELFQYVVPANCWFASQPSAKDGFSFVGCTVSPGFDFADFELANSAVLTYQYPQHRDIIEQMCRQ